MSYADATLDLTSVPVACLSGLNGAGKSALLDAVTWSLWECARASSDEVMRIGEKESWVYLTFLHENRTYRVRRGRMKGGGKSGGKSTSKGTLEFQILSSPEEIQPDALDVPESELVAASVGASRTAGASNTATFAKKDGESWRSLTGGSMKDTQRHINELLRMDYDTFVNSAYLRQGRADEFTTRAPSDRKQILGEILGLSYFEKLKDQARDHARTLKIRREAMEISLARLPEAETELEATTGELLLAREELETLTTDLTAREANLQVLNDRIQSLTLNKQKLESTAHQITELNESIALLEQQNTALAAKLDGIGSLIGQSPLIEEKAQKYEVLRSGVEEMERKALTQQELNTKRVELQSSLAQMRSRLELQAENADTRLNELRKKQAKFSSETKDWERVKAQFEEFRELSFREIEQSKKQEAHTRLSERANELSSQISEEKIRLESRIAQREFQINELNSILTSKESLD